MARMTKARAIELFLRDRIGDDGGRLAFADETHAGFYRGNGSGGIPHIRRARLSGNGMVQGVNRQGVAKHQCCLGSGGDLDGNLEA